MLKMPHFVTWKGAHAGYRARGAAAVRFARGMSEVADFHAPGFTALGAIAFNLTLTSQTGRPRFEPVSQPVAQAKYSVWCEENLGLPTGV